MGRTVVQRWVGDVRLLVHSLPPVPREFDEHVAEAAAMLDRTRVAIVVLIGDGTNCEFDFAQRAKISSAGLFSKRTALLAPQVHPEVVTSQKWLGAEIRAFGPDGFEQACEFLEIAPSQRSEVFDVLVAAKRQLGHPPEDVRPASVAARP